MVIFLSRIEYHKEWGNIQAAICTLACFWQNSLRPIINIAIKVMARPKIIPAPLKTPEVKPEKKGATIILLKGINSVNSEMPVVFTTKAIRNNNSDEPR